tara:strand:+ start:5290 stop:5628 length:339 start_codon:yes stop_codon:yes gene_type:complete
LIEGIHPPISNSITIDHKIPIGKGGSTSKVDNFVLACLECNSEKGDDMAVKKELVVSMSSSEEGVDVNVREAGEVEGGVLFTHEGNKFVVQATDLTEALKELEGFKDEASKD